MKNAILAAGALILTVIVIMTSFTVITMKREINTLRAQQSQAKTGITQIHSRISGANRNVITCQDIQNLGIASYWINAYGELQSINAPLPAHCINR